MKKEKTSSKNWTPNKSVSESITKATRSNSKVNSVSNIAAQIIKMDPHDYKTINIFLKEEAIRNNGPTNARELYDCIKVLWGYETPHTSCSEENVAPFQYYYDMYFDKVDTSVLLAARLSGKTLAFSILTYLNHTFKPFYQTRHAAAIINQAEVASGYLNEWGRDPILGNVFKGKPSKYIANWNNGSDFKIVTGNAQGVSSQHPVCSQFDEIEFWSIEDIEQTWYLPQSKHGYPKNWRAASTRQRSFGCLPHYARIQTEDGPMKIGVVVNSKYTGRVRCVNNETGTVEWKRITNWFRNGSTDEWVKVYLKYTGLGRGGELVATKDHKVYYDLNKKKPLGEFTTNDSLCVPSWQPTAEQEQVLIGTLLGDARLDKGHLRLEHGERQRYYLQWKSDSFTGLTYSESYREKLRHTLHIFNNCAYTHRITDVWYPNGVKRVPVETWDNLSTLGLAVWLMDDGSYAVTGSKKGGVAWHIYALHFNEEERQAATNWFAKLGITISWHTPRKNKPEQKYIYAGGDNARKITELVKDYIDVSNHLGNHSGYKKWIAAHLQPTPSFGLERVPIEKIEIVKTHKQGRYDITVEDNHNYLNGSNVLVSNCMAWLVDEAPERGIKLYQWNVFETMKRCPSCLCIKGGQVISNPESACILWSVCKGEKGTKSSGWVDREEVVKLCTSLGGPDSKPWLTQGLCSKPSTTGLVWNHFEHEYNPDGNYTRWVYQPDLPYYVVHDPAEGRKSVIYFIQYIPNMDKSFIFDELVKDECPDVTDAKLGFYEKCIKENYPDPAVIIVDPRRTDAVHTWKQGTIGGEGIMKAYKADTPPIDDLSGGQEITQGIEEVRRDICDGAGIRRLLINPERCPKGLRGIREYHYPTDNNNVIKGNGKPAENYKDENDPLRYWVRYKNTKIKRSAGYVGFVTG